MYSFWEIIVSNAVFATILAVGTMLLSRIWKNAAALHVLWVVVLLKLFTPPLVTTGLPFAIKFASPAATSHSAETTPNGTANNEVKHAPSIAMTNHREAIAVDGQPRTIGIRLTEIAGHPPWSLTSVLAAIWIGGAGGMAVRYAVQIHRFASVIRDFEPAPSAIRTMATRFSSRLGLRRAPDVLMSTRVLPPLVWSIGIWPRVILPSELFARLSSEAQATILAHELVHIRRGDHLVRLLELSATTVFWWHPVVWCARWQLRELEEQCCDGRVVELLPQEPRTYAATLVDTLEFLCERPRTPVPLPTAIYSTGALSRRIRMLTEGRTNRLTTLTATLVAGLMIVPLAMAFAIDPQETRKPTPDGQVAILRGRVTNEEGAPLADVRVRVAIPAADMRFIDASTDHTPLEAKSDASGDYRLEIPGITKPTKISIDALKPGYCRLVGTMSGGRGVRSLEVVPGGTAEATFRLTPALYFSGTVVDEHGKPISAVKIGASGAFRFGMHFVESTATRPDGSFELFNYPQKPFAAPGGEVSKGVVAFSHPDYIDRRIDDVYAIAPDEREALRIVLETGYKVTGTVLDIAGKPVPNAMVKAERTDGSHRKATVTDANGKFALRGLSKGLTLFSARAFNIKQKIELPMAVNGDTNDLEVRLRAMALPIDLKRYTVLGMQLTDVTPDLKSAYDLYLDNGALILDPGKDSDRLQIGHLAQGYNFFMVGKKRIGSVREFVNEILAEAKGGNGGGQPVRVVYEFSRVEAEGDQYAAPETHEGRPEDIANGVRPACAEVAVTSDWTKNRSRYIWG